VSGTYRTIVADPPWSYRNEGARGVAVNHYSTMSDAAIAALPVRELAATNAVLLLWATWPKLAEALATIAAWGFAYVSGFPWIKVEGEPQRTLWGTWEAKPQYGVGFWVRGCSELLLIARRGEVAPPGGGYIGLLSRNFGHSRKPENLYDYAEQLPGPYLELFARRARPGRDVWGDQVESTLVWPGAGRAPTTAG
jgi:N6-adenosine-specific RNA methylase IME4